jgi:pimeloyl-ACP methyl ester carboxylesterase
MGWLWNSPSTAALLEAERGLLESAGPLSFTVGTTCGLHWVEMLPPATDATGGLVAPPDRLPVVFLAGYGGATGIWLFNLHELGADPMLRVFSVDHLGTGGSDRPPFPMRSSQSADTSAEEAQSFFVDSLEAWRVATGLGRIALVGHSLGGLIAGAYAVKFPDNVALLSLVSPAGLPEPPTNLQPPPEPQSWSLLPSFRSLIEGDYTPHGVARSLGPFGPACVRLAVRRRLPADGVEPQVVPGRPTQLKLQRKFTEAQLTLFAEYMYASLALPASGEFALNALLYFPPGTEEFLRSKERTSMPGEVVLARGGPLSSRLKALAARTRGAGFAVLLTYGGSHDWMTTSCGRGLAEELAEYGGAWARSELVLLPSSGHHCYLEQPHTFNASHAKVLRQARLDHGAALLRGAAK